MESTNCLSIWLIADPPIVRQGWRILVEKAPSLSLRAVNTCKETQANDLKMDCDVAIVDIGNDEGRCWDVISYLRKHMPDLPILVTSSDPLGDPDKLAQSEADKFMLLSGLDGADVTAAVETFFE